MSTRSIFLIVVLFTLLSFGSKAGAIEPEIGGLVIDRTISRPGKEFYRHFSLFWQETPQTQGFNLVVIENNIPRSGTVLWVEINHTKVYQTFFGRRSEFTVRERAEQGLKSVSIYIASQIHQTKSPDLVGDGY